jgi:hypothetical protein
LLISTFLLKLFFPMAANAKARARAIATKDGAATSDDSGEHKHRKTQAKPGADDSDDVVMGDPSVTTMLTTRFDSLTAMLTERFERDDKKEQHILTLLDSFGARFDAVETRFSLSDARDAKIDDQLAHLQARIDAFDARGPSGPAGSASSGTAWCPPAGSARAPPAAASVETLVFFDKAKHDLHRLVLGRYWEAVKKMVSPSLTATSTPHIGNRDTFAIAFPSDISAKDFLAAINAIGGAPDLIDNDGVSHEMEARLQRSKVPTKYGKMLSPVFQHYLNVLRTHRDFISKECTLHADAHRGRIYIEKAEHLILLHTLNPDGASLRTYADRLDEFGLDINECRNAAKLFAAA